MKIFKKVLGLAAALLMLISVVPVSAASLPYGWSTSKPSGSVVSVYGTCNEYGVTPFTSGPVYTSKWYTQVSPKTDTNNESFRIPEVSELFVLKDGWTIDYVSVAANSSGHRQPGASFLLSSSGGSMVYYFKRTTPVTYSLTVKTMVDNVTVSTVGKGSYASGKSVSVSPDKSGFDTVNYNYTFQGWSRESGAGSFASASSENTTFTTGAAATVLVARYTRTEKVSNYNLTVVNGTGSGVYASGSKAQIQAVAPVEAGWVYVFQNWTQTAGLAGTFANANNAATQFTMPKSDATVKANFAKKADTNHNGTPDDEEDKYTVHYDANGGTGAVPADAEYLEGIEVTVAAGVTKPDYVFQGWSDGEKTWQPGEKFEMPAKDVTLTAIFKEEQGGDEPSKPDVSVPDDDISDPDLPLVDGNNSQNDLSDANGEEISDPDVPMGDAPNTGDAFPWMVLTAGIISLGALLAVTKKTARSR